MLMAVWFPSVLRSWIRPARFPRDAQQKSRSLIARIGARRQSSGVACRPVVGPTASPKEAPPIRSFHYKARAKSLAQK
jgi:hypothetical protein